MRNVMVWVLGLAACGGSKHVASNDASIASDLAMAQSDMAMTSCAATFSGAVSGTVSTCFIEVDYSPGTANQWSISPSKDVVINADSTLIGRDGPSFPSMPAVDTYTLDESYGGGFQVTDNGTDTTYTQLVGDPLMGSLTVTFTSLGSPVVVNAQDSTYPSAHGTAHGTLVDSGNTGTVTFDLTF